MNGLARETLPLPLTTLPPPHHHHGSRESGELDQSCSGTRSLESVIEQGNLVRSKPLLPIYLSM